MKTTNRIVLLPAFTAILILFATGCSQKWIEENKGDFILVP